MKREVGRQLSRNLDRKGGEIQQMGVALGNTSERFILTEDAGPAQLFR